VLPLYEGYAQGLATREMFQKMVDEIARERARIEQRLEEIRRMEENARMLERDVEALRELARDAAAWAPGPLLIKEGAPGASQPAGRGCPVALAPFVNHETHTDAGGTAPQGSVHPVDGGAGRHQSGRGPACQQGLHGLPPDPPQVHGPLVHVHADEARYLGGITSPRVIAGV